jgi:hypothetical protein
VEKEPSVEEALVADSLVEDDVELALLEESEAETASTAVELVALAFEEVSKALLEPKPEAASAPVVEEVSLPVPASL